MLYRAVEIPSDEPIQYVGVYVLKWHERPEQPEAGFIPIYDPPLPHNEQDVSVGEFLRQYRAWYSGVYNVD